MPVNFNDICIIEITIDITKPRIKVLYIFLNLFIIIGNKTPIGINNSIFLMKAFIINLAENIELNEKKSIDNNSGENSLSIGKNFKDIIIKK